MCQASLAGASLEPTRREPLFPVAHALPLRERLVTVTRGPMARKKQSRTQLLVRRQVISVRTQGRAAPSFLCHAGALAPFVSTQRVLAQIWGQPLGAPLYLIGARAQWPTNSGPLLAWA
jgi:hypothetical protein